MVTIETEKAIKSIKKIIVPCAIVNNAGWGLRVELVLGNRWARWAIINYSDCRSKANHHKVVSCNKRIKA